MSTLTAKQRLCRSQSPIRKVLVALDLTSRSEATAEYAAYVAKSLGAWLKLIYVHPPETIYHAVSNGSYDLIDVEQLNRRHALLTLSKRISKRYRFCSHAFLIGSDSAEQIALFARKINADLIIVGSHQPSFLAKLLHLDQAPKVIHQAHCPVLIFQE